MATAFHFHSAKFFAVGGVATAITTTGNFYTVPAGKRLVTKCSPFNIINSEISGSVVRVRFGGGTASTTVSGSYVWGPGTILYADQTSGSVEGWGFLEDDI